MWEKREAEWAREQIARDRLMSEVIPKALFPPPPAVDLIWSVVTSACLSTHSRSALLHPRAGSLGSAPSSGAASARAAGDPACPCYPCTASCVRAGRSDHLCIWKPATVGGAGFCVSLWLCVFPSSVSPARGHAIVPSLQDTCWQVWWLLGSWAGADVTVLRVRVQVPNSSRHLLLGAVEEMHGSIPAACVACRCWADLTVFL